MANHFPFNIMIKPCGPQCNLACEYCYYVSKERLYPGADFRMSYAMLEEFTREMIDAQMGTEVPFIWQGGEPTLMGLDFYQEAVRLQNKYAKPHQKIINILQTNGTHITSEWRAFFREHHFLIGLSLEGLPRLHNAYRYDKSENAQFGLVMQAVRHLKNDQIDFNIMCCVHDKNVNHPREVYQFLRDEIQGQFIQFISILNQRTGEDGQETSQLSACSVDGPSYGHFLIKIFDEWVQNDVGRVFIQHFDLALGAYRRYPSSLCVFAETCGQALVLEHNGDLYSCDHFVNPEHFLGNLSKIPLLDLVESPQQHKFGQNKRDTLPEICIDCEFRFLCNGGCPKNRDASGRNLLCEGYRSFFNHIDPIMRTMATLIHQGHSPEDVMRSI